MTNIKKFKPFLESTKKSKKNVDFYYLEDDVSSSEVYESGVTIIENNYRAIATFSHLIKHFDNFDCIKIALVNYPPKRLNHRSLVKSISEALESDIDEIEFIFADKYLDWSVDNWRNIVLMCAEKGVTMRAMVDFISHNNAEIKKILKFLKEIGIFSIMTSTGLVPDVLDLNQLKDVKQIIPNIFDVKVTGVNELSDVENYENINIDLMATSKDLKQLEAEKNSENIKNTDL